MTVVTNEDGDIVMEDPLSQEDSIEHQDVETDEINMQDENGHITTIQIANTKTSSQSKNTKIQKDMETCFGFDEVCFCSKY